MSPLEYAYFNLFNLIKTVLDIVFSSEEDAEKMGKILENQVEKICILEDEIQKRDTRGSGLLATKFRECGLPKFEREAWLTIGSEVEKFSF